MPLTPEDVSNKRFTPVRLREGYDMGEVDQFLDEVEAELERLLKESADLRSQLAAAGVEVDTPSDAPIAATVAQPEAKPEAKPDAKPAEAATNGVVSAQAPAETIKVVTAAEASSAALRLLELATRNADEVVAEAKEEAGQILVAARGQADQVEQEARSRAQNLDSETETRRVTLLGDLEHEKLRLDEEVDTLRAFEREYRSRLKSYFTEQLQALDQSSGVDDLPADGPAAEPRRLRSILDGNANEAGPADEDLASPGDKVSQD